MISLLLSACNTDKEINLNNFKQYFIVQPANLTLNKDTLIVSSFNLKLVTLFSIKGNALNKLCEFNAKSLIDTLVYRNFPEDKTKFTILKQLYKQNLETLNPIIIYFDKPKIFCDSIIFRLNYIIYDVVGSNVKSYSTNPVLLIYRKKTNSFSVKYIKNIEKFKNLSSDVFYANKDLYLYYLNNLTKKVYLFKNSNYNSNNNEYSFDSSYLSSNYSYLGNNYMENIGDLNIFRNGYELFDYSKNKIISVKNKFPIEVQNKFSDITSSTFSYTSWVNKGNNAFLLGWSKGHLYLYKVDFLSQSLIILGSLKNNEINKTFYFDEDGKIFSLDGKKFLIKYEKIFDY